MKLLLTVLALLQVSHTLHIRQETRNAGLRHFKRVAQDTASKDLINTLSTDGSNTKKPKKPIPWWKLPNTDNGEMNAISGEQLYPFGDDDDAGEDSTKEVDTEITAGDDICPIRQCQSSGALGKYYCGQNARCLGNYCQCNFGWKPASNESLSRGWTGLEALTVWVDASNSGCTERCGSLSCSEVPQVKGCFDQHVTHNDDDTEDNNSQGSQEGLATDSLHLGAIKAPGADAGIGV